MREDFRIQRELAEPGRKRPYLQETRQAAIEQPVVAFGALRIVTADIKDVPACDQRWLCAHARPIRHEEPPPLRRWSWRGAWWGSWARDGGRAFRKGGHIPR